MKPLSITKEHARRFLVLHHGLRLPYEFKGKPGVLGYIKRVGCIQFDALNIVGRNPELVLQSKVQSFRPEILDELLYKERRLLDGFDKEMSIYSVEDWPYFRRLRDGAVARHGQKNNPIYPILPQVRQRIEEKGPLSSADLELNQKVRWAWGPTRLARAALESMYFWGELVIHHKANTRKFYDLANRHIAKELLTTSEPNKTENEYFDWYVLRRIGAVGLLWNKASDSWRSIHGLHSKERQASIANLLQQKKLIELLVEGVKYPLYIRAYDNPRLKIALEWDDTKPRAVILAPLDNMLWDRELIKELFDFEYRWEVYKPVKERKYGYYVLPVLYNDRFIARFEPGRDKYSSALVIKNWWWEKGIKPSTEIRAALKDCFTNFLGYLGAKNIKVEKSIIEREGLDWLPLR